MTTVPVFDTEKLDEAGLKLDEDGWPCCKVCGSDSFVEISQATLRSYWSINEYGQLRYDNQKVLGEDSDGFECNDCGSQCSPDDALETCS